MYFTVVLTNIIIFSDERIRILLEQYLCSKISTNNFIIYISQLISSFYALIQ